MLSVLASQLVARAVGRFGLTWHWVVWRQAVSASVRLGQWGEVRWGEEQHRFMYIYSLYCLHQPQVGCPHITQITIKSHLYNEEIKWWLWGEVFPGQYRYWLLLPGSDPLTLLGQLSRKQPTTDQTSDQRRSNRILSFPCKYSIQFTSRDSSHQPNDAQPQFVYSDQVFGRPPLSLGMT